MGTVIKVAVILLLLVFGVFFVLVNAAIIAIAAISDYMEKHIE